MNAQTLIRPLTSTSVQHLQDSAGLPIQPRLVSHPLVEDLKRITLCSLGEQLEQMFRHSNDALLSMSETAENDAECHAHFNAMRVLGMEEPTITRNFQRELSRAFGGISAPATTTSMRLALMPEQELEENIQLSRLTSKVKTQNKELIENIEMKLGALERSLSLPPTLRAITPRRFCDAYCSVLNGLDLGFSMRRILLNLFDRYVLAQLSLVYEDILAVLDRHDLNSLAKPATQPTTETGSKGIPREKLLANVHKTVAEKLEGLTAGRQLHPGLEHFLCAGIAPLLSVRLLREGIDSKLWSDAMDRTGQIIRSFEVQRCSPVHQLMRTEYIEAMTADLREIGLSEPKITGLIQDLTKAYAELDQRVRSRSPAVQNLQAANESLSSIKIVSHMLPA